MSTDRRLPTTPLGLPTGGPQQLLRFGPTRFHYARVVDSPSPDLTRDFSTFDGDATLAVASVPEPSSLAMATLGGVVLVGHGRRRRGA